MPRSGRLADSLPLVLVLAAAALIWPASLTGPFQFDDWNVIVESPAVHSLSAWWAAMPGMRPLLKLSYALDWSAGGAALPFHRSNLIIHALNILLVWRLLNRWPGLSRTAVLVATAAFALHPAQTEAVTYISGRSMALMASFWLLAANLWTLDRRTADWLAALFFLLALGVRETAVTLPFALLAWQMAGGSAWRPALARLRPLWLVLGLALLAIAALPAYRRLLADTLTIRDPLANLALQIDGLRYLCVDVLLGLRNNIDPDLPTRATFAPAWWLTLSVLAGALFWACRNFTRHPGPALAILWPLILLLPTNGPLARLDTVAERHLYLALIGPAVLLGGALDALAPRPLARAAPFALAIVLGWATADRIRDYRCESALWEATAQVSPGKARVWNNLGYAYLAEGKPGQAVGALERALALDPDFMWAAINLDKARAAAGL